MPRSWLQRAEARTAEIFGVDRELSVRDTAEACWRDEGEGDGSSSEEMDKDRILWIGDYGLAGMKLRVREKRFMRQQLPLLMPVDEVPAVRPSLKTILSHIIE